jgi:large subunit ribosomal protein L5
MKEGIDTTIEKIVLNTGLGRLSQQAQFPEKILPQITEDLKRIAGQAPQVRRARKSIAGFKTREGSIVGLRTTLRGKKMVDFFERLITIALPRIRDFRGINPSAIDANGNLNIGIRDHSVFPEINAETSWTAFGLEITIVVRQQMHDRDAAVEMYKKYGVPLR